MTWRLQTSHQAELESEIDPSYWQMLVVAGAPAGKMEGLRTSRLRSVHEPGYRLSQVVWSINNLQRLCEINS